MDSGSAPDGASRNDDGNLRHGQPFGSLRHLAHLSPRSSISSSLDVRGLLSVAQSMSLRHPQRRLDERSEIGYLASCQNLKKRGTWFRMPSSCASTASVNWWRRNFRTGRRRCGESGYSSSSGRTRLCQVGDENSCRASSTNQSRNRRTAGFCRASVVATAWYANCTGQFTVSAFTRRCARSSSLT